MVLLTIIGFCVCVVCFLAGIFAWANDENVVAALLLGAAIVGGVLGWYGKTHHIVPVQNVGIAVNTITQEISSPQNAGIIKKPFFSKVYNAPHATSYERCETYYPAIKGGYEIFANICFYYDTTQLDWVAQIKDTGRLSSEKIMDVWRTRAVSRVSSTFNHRTPRQVGNQTLQIEDDLFDALSPLFEEHGVTIARISFENWDFTDEDVASEWDKSIASQAKIEEQSALMEAAELSREREYYEADTAIEVATKYRTAMDELGLTPEGEVQYMWMQAFLQMGQIPETIIIGGNTPVTVPAK